MKIVCSMCMGIGETHEIQTYPDDPAEWYEPCDECRGTGRVEISFIDYIKNVIQLILFKIRCIPYILRYKQPIDDDDIPF